MISLLLANNTEWPVTPTEVAFYQERYPGIAVENEFTKMARWLEANPKRRPKSHSTVRRFIVNWLAKAKPEQQQRHHDVMEQEWRQQQQHHNQTFNRHRADSVGKAELAKVRRALGMPT